MEFMKQEYPNLSTRRTDFQSMVDVYIDVFTIVRNLFTLNKGRFSNALENFQKKPQEPCCQSDT